MMKFEQNEVEVDYENTETECETESILKSHSSIQKTNHNVPEPVEIERETVKSSSRHILHYKDAENIIQKKCKKFVQVQEIQENISSILVQTNIRVTEQIKEEQKKVDVLMLEAEKIRTQETRSREELVELQQFVENAGEIKEKLKEYTATMSCKIKNINSGLDETFKKTVNQNETFKKTANVYESNIQRLKKEIDAERSSGTDDSTKKENERLRQIITEKKNNLETLKTKLEENKKHEELNYKLKEERDTLKVKLSEDKAKLNEIREKTKQAMVDKNFIVLNFEQELDAKLQRKLSLENEVALRKEKIAETKLNLQKLEEEVREERSKFDDLQEKTESLKKHIAELENKLNFKEHEKRIDDIKSKIASAENRLVAVTTEIDEKIKQDDQLFLTYSSKTEEKNALIERQLNGVKVQLLHEQLATMEKKIEEARDKFNNIDSEPCLVELEKQNTYMETCKIYYEENKKILEDQKYEEEKSINDFNHQLNEIKKKIKEHQKGLTPNLQDVKNISSSLPGILKKGPGTSTSPKTVQFLNISSQESSDTYSSEQQAAYDRIIADYDKVDKKRRRKE